MVFTPCWLQVNTMLFPQNKEFYLRFYIPFWLFLQSLACDLSLISIAFCWGVRGRDGWGVPIVYYFIRRLFAKNKFPLPLLTVLPLLARVWGSFDLHFFERSKKGQKLLFVNYHFIQRFPAVEQINIPPSMRLAIVSDPSFPSPYILLGTAGGPGGVTECRGLGLLN